MENFQDSLRSLVEEWVGKGDDPESMISDLESEIERLKNIDTTKQRDR